MFNRRRAAHNSYATQFMTPQQLLLTQLAHDIFSLDDQSTRLKSLAPKKKIAAPRKGKKPPLTSGSSHKSSISGTMSIVVDCVGTSTMSTKDDDDTIWFFSRHYHHRLYVHAQHYDGSRIAAHRRRNNRTPKKI